MRMIIDEFTDQNLNLHPGLLIITMLITGPENFSKWFVLKVPANLSIFVRVATRFLKISTYL